MHLRTNAHVFMVHLLNNRIRSVFVATMTPSVRRNMENLQQHQSPKQATKLLLTGRNPEQDPAVDGQISKDRGEEARPHQSPSCHVNGR